MLDDVMDEKKEYKKQRNKRDLRILRQLEDQKRERARVKELEEQAFALEPPPEPKETAMVWSAKTQEIRNRLTSRKRMARERWNRFAGTSDGGGRGL